MLNDEQWLLPDPFRTPDGSRIGNAGEWLGQREHLLWLLAEGLYGTMPPRPDHVDGDVTEHEPIWDGDGDGGGNVNGINDSGIYERVMLHITDTPAGVDITYPVSVFRPGGERSHPVVVLPNYRTPDGFHGCCIAETILRDAVSRGYAVAAFDVDEAAPDDPKRFADSPCIRAYPGYTWKALAVWGWLQSRVIDWLGTQPFADPNRIVVTGHSRMGKAALCCGAYDDRAAVVAPAGSGCGGMASLRLSGNRFGEGVGEFERIGSMAANFPHWVLASAEAYGSPDGRERYRENELPFDSNTIASCVAPRGLIALEGLDDGAANQFGTQAAWAAAGEVYLFLDAGERCAMHYREGGHAFTAQDWRVLLDFCDMTFGIAKHPRDWKIAESDMVTAGHAWHRPE